MPVTLTKIKICITGRTFDCFSILCSLVFVSLTSERKIGTIQMILGEVQQGWVFWMALPLSYVVKSKKLRLAFADFNRAYISWLNELGLSYLYFIPCSLYNVPMQALDFWFWWHVVYCISVVYVVALCKWCHCLWKILKLLHPFIIEYLRGYWRWNPQH